MNHWQEIFKKALHVCKKSLHQNQPKYRSSRCRERARENLALAGARTTILRNIGPRASEELSFEMRGLGQAGWRSEGVTQSNGNIFDFCHWSSKILKILVYIRCQNYHFVWFLIIFIAFRENRISSVEMVIGRVMSAINFYSFSGRFLKI